jgi:hypothetical protein
MYKTEDELRALLNLEAESVSLEFKDGAKLNSLSNDARKDLVVDVTAMANSGGGTIIYGIAEQKQRDGRSVASSISPVTDERITQDRLREIIYSNTDPALSGFNVKCIPVAGGQVIVIEVTEGETAYQNKLDRRYYNRVDASSAPMYGFAVRDVMNRRTKPRVIVEFDVKPVEVNSNRHRYHVFPVLKNIGNLTANHWTLHVGLPGALSKIQTNPWGAVSQLPDKYPVDTYATWYEFSSEKSHGAAPRVLPGQSRRLGGSEGFAQFEIEIDSNRDRLIAADRRPSLWWILFLDDAPRTEGELPYDKWSRW